MAGGLQSLKGLQRRADQARWHQPNLGPRRVVRRQRAGGAGRGGIGVVQRLLRGGFDLRTRQHPRAQQHRPFAAAVDDARLDADRARPAVEHRQRRAELLLDMGGAGRADPAEAVRARPGNAGHAEPARCHEQGLRDRVRRAAQANAELAAGGRRSDLGAPGHDDRQRAGPERRHQPHGHRRQARGKALRIVGIDDMHDQWVVRRPALGREDAGDRSVVIGARAQTVDGFGRKRHQFTRREPAGRALDRSGVASVKPHASPARQAEQRGGFARPRIGLFGGCRGQGQVAHLATAPRLGLAVEMQVRAGQRQHAGPVGCRGCKRL